MPVFNLTVKFGGSFNSIFCRPQKKAVSEKVLCDWERERKGDRKNRMFPSFFDITKNIFKKNILSQAAKKKRGR